MRRKRARKKKRFSFMEALKLTAAVIMQADFICTQGYHLLQMGVALAHELSKALHHLYSLVR